MAVRHQLRLGVALFLSLLASMPASYARGELADSKVQALAHYIVAVCHDLNGNVPQAMSEYQKSVKSNGKESAPRLKLGAYFLRLDRIDQALVQLKAVARLSPQDSQAHYLLALVYSSQKKYDLAASEYETILKNAAQNDPSNTEAYLYLGQLYFAQNKYPQAIEELQKILSLEPNNANVFYLLGSVWVESHEVPKAIEAFRRALQIDPGISEALNSLGYTYAQEGVHLDEAISMIRRAIEIDPANGAYQDSLGWALYKKGRYQESLVALEKAETLIEDKILYDHIGDVYQALKQYTQACKYWRKSLDVDPHQILVQQKIKGLEKCIASQSTHRLN